MARVTVEDCLAHVENRFDLVLKAAKRAHDIEMGAVVPMVKEDNDKPTVIALREIAGGYDVTQPVKTVAEEEAEALAAFDTKKKVEKEAEEEAEEASEASADFTADE